MKVETFVDGHDTKVQNKLTTTTTTMIIIMLITIMEMEARSEVSFTMAAILFSFNDRTLIAINGECSVNMNPSLVRS